MTAAANASHSTEREKSDRPDPKGAGAPPRTADPADRGQESAAAVADDAETVDRDALHQADYGGARGPAEGAGSPEPADQQGGLTSDDAAGGGRKPTGDRDKDYDPDGNRTGI